MIGDARGDSSQSQAGDDVGRSATFDVDIDNDRGEFERMNTRSQRMNINQHSPEQSAGSGSVNITRSHRLNISQFSMEQSAKVAHMSRTRSDEEILELSMADAGLNAFGCVFVEMWCMSQDGTRLTRPTGGHWMDPSFAQSFPDESLIDKAWGLYETANDCPPGAGLAGTLMEESASGARRITWRQIKSMMDDPFIQQGSENRMERIFELGIGIVAAVPFSFQDQSGIVLYFTRSTAGVKLLRAPSNERYLAAATDLVGANFCMRRSRSERSALRKSMLIEAVKKVRSQLLKDSKAGIGFGSMVMDSATMAELRAKREEEIAQDQNGGMQGITTVVEFAKKTCKKAWKRVNNSRKKWGGAKLHAPPRQSFSDIVFSFIGAFLTMLTILKLDQAMTQSDGHYDFQASWYSSTLCIVFALTPAPVGQPRQIFAAHLWNMLVGIAIRQIPGGDFISFMDWSDASPGSNYGLPLIWKQSLAVSLGIAGQAYIGMLHPPATGLSFTFVSNPQYAWGTMISVMLCDVIVVFMAMVMLNLEEKKQYPLYWLGLSWEGSGDSIGYAGSITKRIRRSGAAMSSWNKKGEDDHV